MDNPQFPSITRKRKLPDWMMPRGKRGRYNQARPKGRKVALTGRSRFINQLGGWSANQRRSPKVREFEFTTRMRQGEILINSQQITGTNQFRLEPAVDFAVPNQTGVVAVFDSFQKWKVKKVEIFANVTAVDNAPSGSPVSRVQFTIAKWRDNAAARNIMNVPGAQSKIIHVVGGTATPADSELDIMRAACFYPPVSIEGRNTGGTSSLAYLVDPWFDGAAVAGVSFNTFVGQITRSSPSTQNDPIRYTVLYYMKVTFLAKNAAFQA